MTQGVCTQVSILHIGSTNKTQYVWDNNQARVSNVVPIQLKWGQLAKNKDRKELWGRGGAKAAYAAVLSSKTQPKYHVKQIQDSEHTGSDQIAMDDNANHSASSGTVALYPATLIPPRLPISTLPP